MGTPREYGFNDISKENILKADPLSLFFFFSFLFSLLLFFFFFFLFFSFYIFSGRPRLEWPRLAGKLFSWEGAGRGGGGGRGGATTQVKTYSRVCEARASHAWPTAVLVSDRSHESRLDGGRMLSTVLECIGAAGGAGNCRHSPAPSQPPVLEKAPSLSPLSEKSQMKDKRDFFFLFIFFFSFFFQARFRSWGCCNSRTFSWLLDLGTEQTRQKGRLGFALLARSEREEKKNTEEGKLSRALAKTTKKQKQTNNS